MSKQLEPIRIAVLEAHPAIRAGFEAIVGPEPDLELVGCAAEEAELCPLLDRTNPQIVVLDAGPAVLDLCFALKRRGIAAAVVLYVPSLDDALAVGAAVAGAGAVVGWASPHRRVARGDPHARGPPVDRGGGVPARAPRGAGGTGPGRLPDRGDAPGGRAGHGDRLDARLLVAGDPETDCANPRAAAADRKRQLMRGATRPVVDT